MIYWSDETGICNQDQIGRGYAPKGQTPVLTQTAQKFSTHTIAAVSNRGLMRFKLYKGALNVAIFIDFLKCLIKDAKQKVFLIVDNLRVHHAKAVQDWLAQHKDDNRSNPTSRPTRRNTTQYEGPPNNYLKQTIKNKPRAKTPDDLVTTTLSILKSIQKRPNRVKSYFHVKLARIAPPRFDATIWLSDVRTRHSSWGEKKKKKIGDGPSRVWRWRCEDRRRR